MTQEEKAKRYDEAYKVAESIHRFSSNCAEIKRLEQIFPELAESEDEKIRKHLIKHFRNKSKEDWNGVPVKSVLSWLEKQGDKDKLIQELGEYKVKYTQKVLEKCTNKKDDERLRKTTIDFLKEFADKGYENAVECISWLEKRGEQPKKVSIWKHWKDGICGNGEGKLIYLIKNGDTYKLSSCLSFECDYIELSELDKLLSGKKGEHKPDIEIKTPEESLGVDSDTYNKIVDECVYGEQKPAWSEEDENVLEDIEEAIINYWHGDTQDILLDWLKSLKDRVQPQPKQEWSEEDEATLTVIGSLILDNFGAEDASKTLTWLHSLKPQNTWKPSDEQLNALHDAAVYVDKSMFPYRKGFLMKLYKQLKKLREE